MNDQNHPDISIILPVYNSEKYLEKCLKSLLQQTYKNIEILCINDGSTDLSYDILKKYSLRDNRIKLFTQKNSGPAATRNCGLAHMSGKYLMFCDSDDEYHPNMCEEMLRAIKKHNVDFVMCDCNVIHETESQKRDHMINYHKLKLKGKFSLTSEIKTRINVLLWNKIFRTDHIRNFKIDFPAGFECDDIAFVYKYISVSKTMYGLDKILYDYKLRTDSIMGKLLVQKKTKMKTYDKIYAFKNAIEFFKKNGILMDNLWILKNIQPKKLHTFWHVLSEKERIVYYALLKKHVLDQYPAKTILSLPSEYENIILCYKGKYNKILQKKKQWFGGCKKKATPKSPKKWSFYFAGILLFKKKWVADKKVYYILGIPVYKKNIKA